MCLVSIHAVSVHSISIRSVSVHSVVLLSLSQSIRLLPGAFGLTCAQANRLLAHAVKLAKHVEHAQSECMSYSVTKLAGLMELCGD